MNKAIDTFTKDDVLLLIEIFQDYRPAPFSKFETHRKIKILRKLDTLFYEKANEEKEYAI